MALKANLSGLPGADKPGNLPDANPRFGPALAQSWAKAWVPESELPFAIDGTRLRASWAGKCARDISYRMTSTPPSNPPDLAGFWRMGLGAMVHERMQAVLLDTFPNAEVEKLVDFRPELDGSAHVDAFLLTEPGQEPDESFTTVLELKTKNGWGFKSQVGARGAAEGPAATAIIQGALAAHALAANELVVVSLSLECLSDRELAKLGTEEPTSKFIAEWTYDQSTYDPIALEEINRMNWISKLVDAGELAPRYIPFEMPPKARVIDAKSGAWTLERNDQVIEAGTTWFCAYCDFQDQCVRDQVMGR